MKTHVIRLLPGQDLRLEIDKLVREENIAAGCILTCVGNLSKVVIRLAGAKSTDDHPPVDTYTGTFEIVSLVGTLESGNSHLHISFSNDVGVTVGGHLRPGSIVGVTAEVVIGELDQIVFERKLDPQTGYEELVVNEI